MDREVYEAYYRLEEAHWYFTARRRIIFELLRRYPPSHPTRGGSGRTALCDLGTGCGLNLKAWGELYDAVGMDFSLEAARFARMRDMRVVLGRLPGDVPFADSSFDAVLMLDVLEHVEDDLSSLRAAACLLRPGGVVLFTVPAYEWLWDQNDEHCHHYRRYTLRQVRGLASQAGLTLLLDSYYNALLFPLSAAVHLWRKHVRPLKRPPGPRVMPGPVNRAFDAILGTERLILPHARLPFGRGIVCVARRSDGAG